MFCSEILRGIERVRHDYPPELVAERFKAWPDLMPHTLGDCLHELAYWHDLYRLRLACDPSKCYDNSAEVCARDWFVFGLLAELRPRNREEAKATLRYLMTSQRDGMPEAEGIIMNLIG